MKPTYYGPPQRGRQFGLGLAQCLGGIQSYAANGTGESQSVTDLYSYLTLSHAGHSAGWRSRRQRLGVTWTSGRGGSSQAKQRIPDTGLPDGRAGTEDASFGGHGGASAWTNRTTAVACRPRRGA